jgi:two-component system sensor histidine kinase DesK
VYPVDRETEAGPSAVASPTVGRLTQTGDDICHARNVAPVTAPVSPHPTSTALLPHGGGVRATWWYTFVSAVFFAATVLFVWFWLAAALSTVHLVLYFGASFVWGVALVVSALGIPRAGPTRRRATGGGWSDAVRAATTDEPAAGSTRERVVTIIAGIVAAVAAGLATESWALPTSLALSIVVLRLPRGVRGRTTALATVLIVGAAIVDHSVAGPRPGGFVPASFAVALPAALVSTLWWWEIVRELDRSRRAEAKLAAADERLRLADDVHDLQGHHLQVIALQLELAERLLPSDPDAALAQVHAAQRSVDEARAGTRALATRFRGVPLPDELANAVDLLRAAGLDAELDTAPDAALAPHDALGPVVREATTNILKHGGARWARLRLSRDGDRWRLRIENDLRGGAPDGARDRDLERGEAAGSGIAGMAGRVDQAGGTLTASAHGDAFVVDVDVPAEDGTR